MSTEPVAELTLALLGDPASFERMMAGAEARLDKFLARVDAMGVKLQASLDKTLGAVATNAGKLDGALEPVITAFGNVASSASVAGEQVKIASGELGKVSGNAKAAAESLEKAGKAGKGMGEGVASGTSKTLSGVSKAQSALNGFLGTVNKVRAAANKPIVQRVRVERSGGVASGRNVSGEAHIGSDGGGLETAGNTLLMSGVALATPLIAATGAVNDFDRAILNAANNTTMTAQQVDVLRQNVMTLGKETNAPLDKVADAFMRAANFGYVDARGMDVVRVANEAAVAANADLEKTTTALAQTMNQFGVPVQDAGRVMNLLAYASDSTNQKLDSFVATAGRGFQAAATLGVGLADAAAVMGVLTEKGLSAAQSQTALRSIVKGIIQPSKAASDEIANLSKKTGIDLVGAFSAAGLAHYGLVGVMNMATKATHGHADELKKVFTDSKNFVPMLTLMKEKHAELTRVITGSEKAYQENARVQDLYQRRLKSAAYELDNVKNRAVIAGASFEQQLAPALKQVVDLVDTFLGWLQNLTPQEKQMAVNTLAAGAAINILGGVVLTVTGRLVGLVSGVRTFLLWLGKIAPVAAEAGTAETAVATAGLAAFGPGAALIVALTVMLALVGRTADMYLRMRDAINEAAGAGKRFGDQQNQVASTGERGALEVNLQQIAIDRGKLQAALDHVKQMGASGKMADGIIGNEYKPGMTFATAQGRMKKLNADYKTEQARLHQMSTEGAGEADRAVAATGADGFAKSAVGHAFDNINTPKNLASCAFFVSEVFRRAGAQGIGPGGIGRAEDMKNWAENHGAVGRKVKSASEILPGDMIVWHGQRYGKNHSGYHVGMGLGDSKIRQSSGDGPGHIKTMGMYDLAHATVYTIPGSTFTGGGLPSYVTGGAGAAPSPDGNKQRKTASRSALPLPTSLPDLPEYGKLKDGTSSQTTPGNYAEKMAEQDSRLAATLQHLENAQLKSNGAITEGSLAIQQHQATLKTYEAEMSLVNGIVTSGSKTTADAKAKVDAAKESYKQAASAFNAYTGQLSREAKAGQKPTGDELTHRASLAAEVKKTRDAQGDAERAAVASENLITEAKKKQLSLTIAINAEHAKLQHAQDEENKAADEAAKRQASYIAGIQRQTRHLTPKSDFDQRRDDLADQVGDMVTGDNVKGDAKTTAAILGGKSLSGVRGDAAALLAIAQYFQAETARINADQAKDAQKNADETQKYLLEIGHGTLAAYRDYLLTRYQETVAADGQLTEEARRYGQEYWQVQGQILEQAQTATKEALDQGKLSIQQYILKLRDLQAELPRTSEEYKKLQSSIDEASNQIKGKAQQRAEEIGSKFSDAFMQVVNKAKTVKQAVQDAWKEFEQNWIKSAVKNAVTKIALKMGQQSDADKMKAAAQQHEKATNTLGGHVTRLTTGVDKFGGYVGQFVAAVQQIASGASGGSQAGAGGGFGTGDTDGGGSFGIGGGTDGGSFGIPQNIGQAGSATSQVFGQGSGASQGVNGGLSAANAFMNPGSGPGIGSSTDQSVENTGLQAAAAGGGFLGAAAPYLAAALVVASLLGVGKHKETPTSLQSQQYANVLTTFSNTIDSGYSGSDGLRTLLGPTTRQAAGVGTAGQAGPPHQVNITIAAGAFQGIADPVGHANVILDQIQTGLSRMNALDNASRGTG